MSVEVEANGLLLRDGPRPDRDLESEVNTQSFLLQGP